MPVKIIIKNKNSLTKYGYSTKEKKDIRRLALLKSAMMVGINSVIKKLNAVKILNKNRAPKASKIFDADMKFIQKIKKNIDR